MKLWESGNLVWPPKGPTALSIPSQFRQIPAGPSKLKILNFTNLIAGRGVTQTKGREITKRERNRLWGKQQIQIKLTAFQKCYHKSALCLLTAARCPLPASLTAWLLGKQCSASALQMSASRLTPITMPGASHIAEERQR